MSTRAIIALPTKKGYITAWNWNDGSPECLGQELKKYFKTEDDVRSLVSLHSFSTIFGPKQISEFVNDGDTAVMVANNRWVLQHPHDGKVVAGSGAHGFFRTIENMLEQDLNYVYVFENGKWKTYK
ncbi:MAG: hypothetical protein J6Y89_08690 [Lachnospiraceae bacterium]|nr:hypothetical protein [Lachnospiraceae bacterium]